MDFCLNRIAHLFRQVHPGDSEAVYEIQLQERSAVNMASREAMANYENMMDQGRTIGESLANALEDDLQLIPVRLAEIFDAITATNTQLRRIADALEGWHADAEEEQAELTPGEAGIMAARSEY
jgi:hypothetical protein